MITMSETQVKDYGYVKNISVYGLEESIRRAKFPMASDIESLNSVLTKGIEQLAFSSRGSGHDQWLTGIIVQFDLTFSIKAWTEAERYHFFDFVSSQSTMHKITQFDLDESFNNYVDDRIIDIFKEKVQLYNEFYVKDRVDANVRNEKYLEILYSCPTGLKLTAGMTTNYRELKTIYSQRCGHKLPEWRDFCSFITTLPKSYLITGVSDET